MDRVVGTIGTPCLHRRRFGASRHAAAATGGGFGARRHSPVSCAVDADARLGSRNASRRSLPMTSTPLIALLLAVLAAAPALAQTLACPDLRGAKPVSACPTEAELRYTFVGYCSDSARLYDGKADDCTDFAAYRKSKNIALWESADGEFSAYPSCDLDSAAIRAATPVRIAVERKGAITQVACDYGDGIRFTHRTRAACRVEGTGRCETPESCRATCG